MHIDTYEHARIPPGERRNGQKGCVCGGGGGEVVGVVERGRVRLGWLLSDCGVIVG